MLSFFQFLQGYVLLKVWGYSPERFMNLCSNHDIFLWNIVNHGEYYTMCISLEGFRRLRPIVRKTGTRVAIQKRCGLPFFMPKIRRRKIFLVGFLGSLLFWIWMSGYIWAVDLDGNFSVTDDVFMDFLEENEIHVGMKKSQVDIEKLEKSIREEFGIVTWTSARIEGTRLEIQIKENELGGSDKAAEELKEDGQGSDLVAGNDGVIVNMVTRSGVPQVAVNAQVKKGDLLVSGSVPVYNEDATVRKYNYCQADADIYLSCRYTLKEELPAVYEKKQYTGEVKNEYFLGILGKNIWLRAGKVKYEQFDTVCDEKQVKLLDNFYLPITYGRQSNREYVVQKTEYGKEEVKRLLGERLSKFIQTLEEKGVQIIEKDVKIRKNDGRWLLTADFQVIEKTGERVPIVPRQPEEVPEEEQGRESAEDGQGVE